MTWMNEHEIEEALRLTAVHELPNLRRAAEALSHLKDWTNSKSDGWPYWQKPAKAANRLMELLQTKIRALYRSDTEDITEQELKRLLTPIKSFLTREGANHEEVLRTAKPTQTDKGNTMSFKEPDNADRASFARVGVEAYAARTRSGSGASVTVDDPTDPDDREHAEEVIGDLLGDLRHLCQAWGIDFDEVSERGRWHFEHEVAEEAEMKKSRVNQS